MRENENIYVLSGILFVITAIVALMLSVSNSVTEDKIKENNFLAEQEARISVFPDASDFELLESSEEGIVREIYSAKSQKGELGWCVSVASVGYNGEIQFIVGIDKSFKTTGLKVISMSETAGLGAKVGEEKFLSQFKGKDANDGLSVRKSGEASSDEIMAVTGATVSSTAIKNGINEAVNKIKGGKIG